MVSITFYFVSKLQIFCGIHAVHLGKYERASDSKDCELAYLIKTKDECKTASLHVGHSFQENHGFGNTGAYPAGCGWNDAGDSYFNPDMSGNANGVPNTNVATKLGGICKIKGSA